MGDILFLAHRVPFPPNRGDKIRAHHILRKLVSIAPVHVGCFAETEEDRAAEAQLARIAASHCVPARSKPLVLAGVEAVLAGKPVSLTAFHSARLEKWVRQTLAERDISTIVVFSGQMGQYIPDEFQGRVIVDLCDVDSAKFEGYADTGERVWLNAREGRLLAREEERLGRRADATILISANEAELYRGRLTVSASVDVQVMGNGIDAEFFDPRKVKPQPDMARHAGPQFVFTGQMDYPPNEQAALWVIERLLPAIRQRHPDAEFHVVGRNPTSRLVAKAGCGGVSITGEVPDVRPYLAAADCVIAPLKIARGVQNKVLEAMAMRCAVLLSPEAATGIAGEDGKHWKLASAGVHAMIPVLDELLGSENARHSMGCAARDFVLEHHAWDAMLAPLEELVTGASGEARNAA
ncbi:TIGR03087 family PEP-CTERM/XrtA system glycosyltransferase [Erythrobacter sp. GH1-10]|uniref:TIGR03087 family PEP-CTERM/XrtA system glycosyltransferase n=1 Tax=Erythrobacter sp. GH1-10 TaxID=3349334 RepID=UPI00387819C8